MVKPKFYELQRLRESTWDTPRVVQGYDLTLDDRLILPRGLRHTVATIVERAGPRLAVTDARNPGTGIDGTFTAELTGMQANAVGALLAHDDGILVAPPGSGETVMTCAVIAERNTSALVLVDRKALADRWRIRIEQFLGIKPGQLGGGRRKLTGTVDIALLPSLARRDDVATLTQGTGTSSSTNATTSAPPRTSTRSNGSPRSSGSASPPPPPDATASANSSPGDSDPSGTF
jgi:hypothetical protein